MAPVPAGVQVGGAVVEVPGVAEAEAPDGEHPCPDAPLNGPAPKFVA